LLRSARKIITYLQTTTKLDKDLIGIDMAIYLERVREKKLFSKKVYHDSKALLL